jgi:hypothetical protein
MNIKVVVAAAIAFSLSTSVFAGNKPTEKDKADAAAINSACEADAKATGCSGMVVGKGLLKCMHKYKHQHKDYKFSDGCKSAMKQLKEDKEEGK